MTSEIGFLLLVLGVMVYFFMTEKLPVELTAFIGLLVLVFTDYVPVEDAFTGFSSPAVMTMFAIFFISGALLQTGVADVIGQRLHALGGGREVPLIVLIMVVAGVLSAFMNNVAACAVLLPAIASLARRSEISPSRLFMPLSFGAILGGTTTLVGTPPNILAAEALSERGLEPFNLFDFTPMGLTLLAVGILFMTTIGRRLLPEGKEMEAQESSLLTRAYRLEDRLTSITVPAGSALDGLALRDTRLGTALGVRVIAVDREGEKHLAPTPDFRIRGGDQMVVDGHFADLQELLRVQGLGVSITVPGHVAASSTPIRGAALRLTGGSGFIGRTLAELEFRHRFQAMVVGIRREGDLLRHNLARRTLRGTDELLVICGEEQMPTLRDQKAFRVQDEMTAREVLDDRLFLLRIPDSSSLVGQTMATSRIGELVGTTVVGIVRDGETILALDPDEKIRADDELLVTSEPTRILDLLELGDLKIEESVSRRAIESEEVGVTEVVISPRAQIAGATPKELDFREKYGLQVLAMWRQGELIHRGLADIRLAFGDALFLHGPREKIARLSGDADFVVLTQAAETPRRTAKAPVALAALAVMIALVASGLYPIHVAAFSGAVVAVLFGALKMEEAYRLIEWRALFLVAAILPAGVAMERSGAAAFLANLVVGVAGQFGPYAFLAALALLASLLSQGLDGAPTVVILAPVVILAADQLQVSPYPLMMVVGLAASAAFMTPFSHKANLLVMSAGGYRASDYVRVGTPLTVVVLALLVLLVPIFFPLEIEPKQEKSVEETVTTLSTVVRDSYSTTPSTSLSTHQTPKAIRTVGMT